MLHGNQTFPDVHPLLFCSTVRLHALANTSPMIRTGISSTVAESTSPGLQSRTSVESCDCPVGTPAVPSTCLLPGTARASGSAQHVPRLPGRTWWHSARASTGARANDTEMPSLDVSAFGLKDYQDTMKKNSSFLPGVLFKVPRPDPLRRGTRIAKLLGAATVCGR